MTREEAINEIKSWDFLNGKEIEAVQTLIPELRESEDERIRQDLIGGLMWQRDNLKSEGPHDNNLILPGFCLTVGKHLAYLEKHKEQKPAISFSDAYAFLSKEGYIVLEMKEYDELIEKIEQKPVEWSEEEIGHLYTLASYIKSKGYEDDGEFLEGVANKLKSLRPQKKEDLPKWKPSEEQMKALKAVCGSSTVYTCIKEVLSLLYNDLLKLKLK